MNKIILVSICLCLCGCSSIPWFGAANLEVDGPDGKPEIEIDMNKPRKEEPKKEEPKPEVSKK